MALAAEDFDEQDRKSVEIAINWFLSFCKRSRSPVTRRSANAFVQTAKPISERELERTIKKSA